MARWKGGACQCLTVGTMRRKAWQQHSSQGKRPRHARWHADTKSKAASDTKCQVAYSPYPRPTRPTIPNKPLPEAYRGLAHPISDQLTHTSDLPNLTNPYPKRLFSLELAQLGELFRNFRPRPRLFLLLPLPPLVIRRPPKWGQAWRL